MAKNDYNQIPSPFSSFDPFSIGFDKSFKTLTDQLETLGKNVPGYPPYNIKKVDDNKYVTAFPSNKFMHEAVYDTVTICTISAGGILHQQACVPCNR